jgi:hypothetical protein
LIICNIFTRFQITERLCSAALKVHFRYTRCFCTRIRPMTKADVRAQDIVKLIVDEGETTFRRKPKSADTEPDTGSISCASSRILLRLNFALQVVGSCCTGGKLRYRARLLLFRTNCSSRWHLIGVLLYCIHHCTHPFDWLQGDPMPIHKP